MRLERENSEECNEIWCGVCIQFGSSMEENELVE